MGARFDKIFESVVSRYQVGGYLPGDVVAFRPSYKSTDCFKSMNSAMQKEIDELIKSGLNIRVIQVGDKMSGASAGNQHKSADMVVVTVAADQGGGRYYNSYTVTPNMIDLVDQSDFTVKVPEKFYHNSKVDLKPVEYVTDQQNITRLTDKGNGKATPNKLNESYGTQVTKDNASMAMLFEEAIQKSDRITDKDRHRITNVVTQHGLDGNGRFQTVGQALNALTQALDGLGYSLDAVTGNHAIASAHHTPGAKGNESLTFRRKNLSGDPYTEEPEIENSRISFNWENLGRPGIEVVAYAS